MKLFVPTTVKALIFDCDGTLADTMPIHWDAWQEAFEKYDVQCPQKLLEDFKGVPVDKIAAHINQVFGYHIPIKEFTDYKETLVQQKLIHAQPLVPVVEIVLNYHKRLPMAVASGSPLENVLLTLDAIGLADIFETIITADDPVAPKPSPEIFLEAARRLKIAPHQCQVFEDSDLGLQAAQKARMLATDVRPFI